MRNTPLVHFHWGFLLEIGYIKNIVIISRLYLIVIEYNKKVKKNKII